MAFKTSDDLRLSPVYSVAEAADYLRIPEESLRSWVAGRLYPVAGHSKRSRALIQLNDPNRLLKNPLTDPTCHSRGTVSC